MQITVNGKTMNLPEYSSITELIYELKVPDSGIALALNQDVIAQHLWSQTQLKNNDVVDLFTLVAGG